MRTAICGVLVGFRIVKGQGKDASDYGKLFICQVGDNLHDADLITVYVQELDLLEILLNQYADGQLKWIDTYCSQAVDGREKVWMLEQIMNLSSRQVVEL